MGIDVSEAEVVIADSTARAAHSCYFYSAKQDLLDVVVPYLQTGLEQNESCVWIISEPLTLDEARAAVREALPDIDRYETDGSLELLPHNEWYLSGGALDCERVVQAWRDRLDRALARGCTGLRAAGDTSWLEEKDWPQFLEYERQINHSFADQPMTVLCTFPLTSSRTCELLDVAHFHESLEIRRNGSAEALPTTELKRAIGRTQALAAANARLRSEIAERKEVEKELRKHEEILQEIFDRVPVMIAMFDPDGRYKLVNRAWQGTMGWTMEELLKQNVDVLRELYPDPRDLQRALDFIAASNGEWGDFKTTLKDGRRIDTSWCVTRFSDGSRFAIGKDITARKGAERALRESEERFRQLAENIRELFWIKSPDLKQAIYLSPIYESMMGLDRATRFQEDGVEAALQRICPEDRDKMAAFMQRATTRESEIEFRIVLPDGSLRWIHTRTFPIRDESGKVYRVAGISRNVTDQKLAEERLKATTEQLRALSASLQSARERERARIAREVHDELGSALTSLKWGLEDIQRVFSEPAQPAGLAVAQEKTASMMKMTDTIINAVRRIASDLRPSILDDIGLTDAVEWQMQQFQSRSGILCRCSRSLENVSLDREQATAVFRIFQEALTNILRHARADRVEVTMDESENVFTLTVTDNGRGIRETEKSGPLALGLLGMRERAALVGGRVEVQRVKGSGTAVTVIVPANSQ